MPRHAFGSAWRASDDLLGGRVSCRFDFFLRWVEERTERTEPGGLTIDLGSVSWADRGLLFSLRALSCARLCRRVLDRVLCRAPSLLAQDVKRRRRRRRALRCRSFRSSTADTDQRDLIGACVTVEVNLTVATLPVDHGPVRPQPVHRRHSAKPKSLRSRSRSRCTLNCSTRVLIGALLEHEGVGVALGRRPEVSLSAPPLRALPSVPAVRLSSPDPPSITPLTRASPPLTTSMHGAGVDLAQRRRPPLTLTTSSPAAEQNVTADGAAVLVERDVAFRAGEASMAMPLPPSDQAGIGDGAVECDAVLDQDCRLRFPTRMAPPLRLVDRASRQWRRLRPSR